MIRYMGAAGSGKTSMCLKLIEKAKNEQKLTINDLLFISFTRSQINDVKERIESIFPDATKIQIDKNVKTIHGIALMTLLESGIVESPTIITEIRQHAQHYVNFSKTHGMIYEHKFYIDESETDPDFNKTLSDGNVFFKINGYMSTCMISSKNWLDVAEKLHFTPDQTKTITEETFLAWDNYKLDNNLLEHDDYVQICIYQKLFPRKRKMLIVDEFQDVSPAQYELFSLWRDAKIFDTIYIAGDDNQSIYSFRGAEPQYIINEVATDIGATVNSRVKSWRNPSEIINVANLMLGHNSHGDPCSIGGEVLFRKLRNQREFESIVLSLQMKHKKLMILSRTKAGCSEAHTILNYSGIPHTSLTGRFSTWDAATIMKNGKREPYDMRKFILAAYKDPKKYSSILYNDLKFAWSDEFLHKIYFKAIKSERRIDPSTIIIDTIHASKGLECPAVIIYDLGYNPEDNIEEEQRIYYVAATRSSNVLEVLLSSKAKSFCNIINNAWRNL